jgi:hypothetical protein
VNEAFSSVFALTHISPCRFLLGLKFRSVKIHLCVYLTLVEEEKVIVCVCDTQADHGKTVTCSKGT